MPVKLLKNDFELADALRTKTPLGYVVIYIFDEASPVHAVLSPLFEEISRRATFSYFFAINSEGLPEKLLADYKITSFPTFLVALGGNIKHNFQVATKEGLIEKMVEATVISKDEKF